MKEPFDYIAEAEAIRNDLPGPEFQEWRERIESAIAGAATGSELMDTVRGAFDALLRSDAKIEPTLRSRMRRYSRAVDAFLRSTTHEGPLMW
jgi:hypothetical protein